MSSFDREPYVLNPYQVRARLLAIAQDESILAADNLAARAEALELLELADEISQMRRWRDVLSDLGIESLRSRLLSVNETLFRGARARLAPDESTPEERRGYLDHFTCYRPDSESLVHIGRDALDLLLDGVLGLDEAHVELAPSRHPDMVHYVPAPARAILDMVDHVAPGTGDTFYDLGSGLGRVVILFHLLTGIPAFGVEMEPAYCAVARRYAERLGLHGARFVQADARDADLSSGSLFFMFTPFEGGILDSVFQRLERVAEQHAICLCTYGTVTMAAAQEPWLKIVDPSRLHAYKLAAFESVSRR